MSTTVADVLARALASAGFSPCFGYLGHHVEPLPQSLVGAGCRVVIASSETGAGYMAQGLALASGRPALAFCCGSPGLALLVPCLQVARLEGIPILAVVGQTGRDGLPAFQNTGAEGSRDRELLAAMGIANFHLEAASALASVLQAAWAHLQAGAPVVITTPADLLAAPWIGGSLSPPIRPVSETGQPVMACGTATAAPPGGDPVPGSFGTGGYRALVAALLQSLPADTLWIADAGQPRHAMGIELQRRGIPLLQSANVGCMGWAIAAAVGAACHPPSRPVCCFTGDGSALMAACEWSTAVKLQLPIIFVLAENGVLGGPFGRLQSTAAADLGRLAPVDWCALAAALGLPAARVEDLRSLPDALAALPAAGPRLLVVPLPERDPNVPAPFVLSGEGAQG